MFTLNIQLISIFILVTSFIFTKLNILTLYCSNNVFALLFDNIYNVPHVLVGNHSDKIFSINVIRKLPPGEGGIYFVTKNRKKRIVGGVASKIGLYLKGLISLVVNSIAFSEN